MASAPYWRDLMARERTMCALCYHEGRGWVRIGPAIPRDYQRNRAAFVNRQRADAIRHFRAYHPTYAVRWTR